MHWPRGIAARGELRHNPGHVIDLAPTILELAGGSWPALEEGQPPPPGRSLVPVFARDGTVAHDFLWWLHEGSRAIRVGDWKLVAAVPSLRSRLGQPGPREEPGPWELYNLATDPTETRNLAATMPEKVQELATLWAAKQEEFFQTARQGMDAQP